MAMMGDSRYPCYCGKRIGLYHREIAIVRGVYALAIVRVVYALAIAEGLYALFIVGGLYNRPIVEVFTIRLTVS